MLQICFDLGHPDTNAEKKVSLEKRRADLLLLNAQLKLAEEESYLRQKLAEMDLKIKEAELSAGAFWMGFPMVTMVTPQAPLLLFQTSLLT